MNEETLRRADMDANEELRRDVGGPQVERPPLTAPARGLTPEERHQEAFVRMERETENSPLSTTLRLVSGALVRVLPIHDFTLQRVYAKHPAPKIPMRTIEQPGQQSFDEPDPESLVYLEAVEARSDALAEALVQATLMTCMEILEWPKGVKPYEQDKRWKEEYEMLGLEIPERALARRTEWLRYRIVVGMDDYGRIQDLSNKIGGVTEEKIALALGGFRDQSGRVLPGGVAADTQRRVVTPSTVQPGVRASRSREVRERDLASVEAPTSPGEGGGDSTL